MILFAPNSRLKRWRCNMIHRSPKLDCNVRTAHSILKVTTLLCIAYAQLAWAKGDWPAATREELELKQVPGYPDEHAVILQREEDTDDQKGQSHCYYRIKILTEEGRKFADVEIPYSKYSKVDEIQARTIRPDSSVVEFDGTIYN